MAENELFALVLVAAAVGGGIGARTASHAPWKGALVALGGLLIPIPIVLMLGITSQIVVALLQLVSAGVLSGILGLGGRSASQVVIGAVLAVALVYGLLSLF